jgi:DNA-binding PucR family transcriptional regulator
MRWLTVCWLESGGQISAVLLYGWSKRRRSLERSDGMRQLADPAPRVRGIVEEFARDMLREEQLGPLVELLHGELFDEVPAVASDADVRRGLTSSTRTLLSTLLVEMSKDPAGDFTFPEAAVDFARTLARHGYDVGLLMRLYRIGQRVFWRRVLEEVAERVVDGDLRIEVLAFLWEQSSRVLERNLDALAAVHGEESERRLRGALARRADMVQAILRGEPVGAEQASRQLGHNLHRTQTALVLWADEAAADPSEKLESVAVEAAAAAGAPRPLTIRADARIVWAWLATGADPPLARIRGAPTLQQSPLLRVAVGVPAPGVQGFRDSHREAVRAQAVAGALAAPEQVTCYADVEVVSCLSGDDDALRALVVRELGGLAGPGSSLRRLRETARAYLQVGGSARAAAAELGVHKNTILYRLRQVDELLGHPIDERRLPLELALLLTDAYGGRIMPDDRTDSIAP